MSKFKKIRVILILVGIGLPLVTFFWAGINRWTVPPNFKEISIPTFINITDVILRESDIALRKDKMKGEVYHRYRIAREEGYSDREIAEYFMKQSLNQDKWEIVREIPIEQSSDQNKREMTRKEPINWAE